MNCKNCGAPINPEIKQCKYCGTYYNPHLVSAWNILNNQKFRKTTLYPLSLAFGIIIVVFTYVFMFDKLSETELVQFTPIWYFAIVFGSYGYLAEKIMSLVVKNKARDFRSAYRFWVKNITQRNIILGLLAIILFFPFPFFNKMKPLPVASLGALIWGLMLVVFFQGIFPAL